MAVQKLADGVFSAGVMHWDRRLFDELIPLPDGTSYNSYLVQGGGKTVLIDTVDTAFTHQLAENLKSLGVKKLDYVVANHAEQDHSGSLPFILAAYPEAAVVTNEKCKGMLKDLLLIPEERFMTVKDGEMLALGGKTLEFVFTPWVHWPETMCTYLKEDRILFSCDLFGSHIATSDIFDQEHFYMPAKRYYAEIMSPFRNNVRGNLDRVKKLDIAMIAPSHGIIYKNPSVIMNAYAGWSSDAVRNEAMIAYVSMHDSTKKMAEYLREALITLGVQAHFYNLAVTDPGTLAIALIDSATLVLGAPTVLAGLHPLAANAAYLANALRPKTKFVSLISSFGWGEKATDTVKGMLTNFKAELLTPVLSKGYPKAAEFKELDRLAGDIARKHKELGLF